MESMTRQMVCGLADRKRGGTVPGPARGGTLPRLARRIAAAGLVSAALAACSGARSTVSSAVKPLTNATGFSTSVDEPKPFVTATRSANMDYLAVGITPPSRGQKVLTPDELSKATSQLEETRAAHDKLAGRKPPPANAAAAKAAVKKKPSTNKQDEKQPASQ
jgi:hypothetical protein